MGKFWGILIINLVFKISLLYSIGSPAGTIITNVKDYINKISSFNYQPDKPGELIARWLNDTNDIITNCWNGKYYIINGILMTNTTTVTITPGYDLSSLPDNVEATGKIGTFVDYLYIITNKGNTSDSFYIKITNLQATGIKEKYLISLFLNNIPVVTNSSYIETNINGISPDEIVNLKIRVHIPETANNSSSNLIRFELGNSYWRTNNSGDNWPPPSSYPFTLPDTNNRRDYQVTYIKTFAEGIFHIVNVVSADDMIHKIKDFSGNSYLAPTRIKTEILLDSPPLNNDFYLYYSINDYPSSNNYIKVKPYGSGIKWYAVIDLTTFNIQDNSKVYFYIRLDGEDYFLDGRNGVKYWSFKIKNMKMQRYNITILNNFINPIKGEKTILFYSLDKPSPVNIEVYDLAGEKVATLYSGYQSSGVQQPVYWDGRNDAGKIVAEGLYFISIRTDNLNELRKVIVVK